jgi:ferredoxin-NADP reductase
MASFRSALIKREQIAEGTIAFSFAKPPGFQHKAGQSIDVTVLDSPETDAAGNIRPFSITSPPFADELTIATRMRDTAFKRFLKTAPLGTEVNIEGPSGSFTLHKNTAKPAVFLAGGIGITPFVSIARQAAQEKLPHQLYLFYANRRPEDAAFLKELAGLLSDNPCFHFIATMTDMKSSQRDWRGETGYINREMLLKHLSALQGPIYYVAGPPAMVTAMREMLTNAGVDEDDIRTEEFGGY